MALYNRENFEFGVNLEKRSLKWNFQALYNRENSNLIGVSKNSNNISIFWTFYMIIYVEIKMNNLGQQAIVVVNR